MAAEAAVPNEDLMRKVREIAAEEVRKFARSSFLNNASVSGGNGLSVKDGGALRLSTADGVEAFLVGPVAPDLPDGSPQPGWVVRRADGTVALMLWDPRPDLDGYSQFLGWYDRAGNAVITDDTVSGQGIARPYLPGVFYPSRNTDFLKSTSAAWEPMWRAKMGKQHPKLYVQAWGFADAAGTTGEMRVMVNGAQLGPTQAVNNSIVNFYEFGPLPVAGAFGDTLSIEIQAHRAAGTGNIQVGAAWVEGRQT